LDLAFQPLDLAPSAARVTAVMTARPPAEPESGEHTEQKHAQDQQVERHDHRVRYRPERELGALRIADRDQHADQEEDQEEDTQQELHAGPQCHGRKPHRECLWLIPLRRWGVQGAWPTLVSALLS